MSESAAPHDDSGGDGSAGDGTTIWEQAGDDSNQMVINSFLEDLENKSVKQQEELIQTRQKADELESALKASQTKTDQLQQALQAKAEAFDALQLEFQGANSKSVSLEESSKLNQERMDRLQVEGDKLREEISRLTKENNEHKAKMAQVEAQSKLDDSSLLPLQYQVQRLQTEIDTVQTHSNWLEEELKQKSEELSNVKMTHAAEAAQLRDQADLAQSDKDSLEVELKNLRKAVQDLQKKNGSLSREVYEAKQEAIDTKASTEEELVASRRVADLQKQQLERMKQRYDGMARQLQAIKDMARQAEKDSEDQWKEHEQEIQATAKRILAEQASEYQQKIASMQEQIDAANRRCKIAEDGVLRIEAPPSQRAVLSAGSNRITNDGDEEEPLNLTGLYKRLAEAEDALAAEVTRRTKVEIRFSRLEAEIEANAPIFQQQRQECESAREHEAELRKRTESALNDAAAARSEADMLQAECSRLRSQNEEAKEDARRLAKQVQRMLVTNETGEEDPEVPLTVARMQGANERLLKDFSQLKKEYDELKEKLSDDEKAQEIEQYKRQLEALQSDRKAQDALVTSIVQQRDLYRALVVKTDPKMLGGEDESSALEIVKRQSARSNTLQEENKKMYKQLSQVNAQIEAMTRDKDILLERLERYEVLNSNLTADNDRKTLEISNQKAAVARSEADAAYSKEKVGRLEESIQRIREEMSQVNTSKNRLMKLNGDLEQAISKANAEASKLDAEVRQVRSKLHLAEAQAESAKAAEKRISDEAVQLRSDLSRQGAMIESIQRIESSLTTKNNVEIESYKTEIAALRERLAGMESRTDTDSDNLKGKIADQEIRIQNLEASRAQSAKEALEAKSESVESMKKMEEAYKKAAMLEAQLKAAKKRLGDTSDDQDSESEIRSKLASISADFESAKKQVEKWKERASTYEKLAKDNEKAVAQMSEASNDARKGLDDELANLRQELLQSNNELSKRKEMITELTNDLSSQRADREKAVNEVRKQVSSLKADVDKYQKAAEVAGKRYNEVFAELNVLRQDLSEAQSNYERELSLHAVARSDLRTAREECEKERRLRNSAEQESARIKGELDMQQSLLDAEKSKREEETQNLEKTLEDSRAQNNLLHNQLEKINEQIGRMQSTRLDGDSTGEGQVEDILGDNETSMLRRNILELQELVKFVRSEKDAIQGQLDAARRATDRERSKAAVTLRNLEDATADLKVAQEASNEKAADANALSEKVKSVEEQCRLLKDSNAHLQQQVLELQNKLSKATADLEQAQNSLLPSEKLQKELESEKAALLSEKESLMKENDDWKKRVQSLVSKFNQVDPEEHKKLVKTKEDLEKQVMELNAKKLEAETETKRIRGLASRASIQLTQNKQLVENQKKTITKLTADKEALAKSQKDGASPKEINDLKEKIAKLEKEGTNQATLHKSANDMNEKLRERLRQFQKTIQGLQKDKTDLETKLNEAQAKLTKMESSKKVGPETTGDKAATTATFGTTGSAGESSTAAISVPKASSASVEKESPSLTANQTKLEGGKVVAPASTSEMSSLKVPEGGFKFGPSETPPAGQQKAADTSAAAIPPISKKRAAETSPESRATKRPLPLSTPSKEAVVPGNGKDGAEESKPSDPAPSSPKPSPPSSASRRSSGEMKELSMKEKLLERKRKLLEKLVEKKKEQQESTSQEDAKSPMQTAEPTAKKSKTDSDPDTSSKPDASSLDPQAKPFVPTMPEDNKVPETSVDDAKRGNDDGEVHVEQDATETAESSKETPQPPTNPFGTTPSTSSIFGSVSGAKPATFGSVFGSGGSAPAFGQMSTFGSGGTFSRFGSAAPSGAPSIFGSAKKSESEAEKSPGISSSGSFLDMKPPGSSAAPPQFTFGTSSNITLPTPTTNLPAHGNMFGAFTNPFGAAGAVGAGSSGATSSTSTPLVGKDEAKEESEVIEEGEEDEEGEEGEMEEDSEQA